MNLTQLRYFNQTVKCKGVSAAALKLFVTQPAVTKQIKLLEEEVGNKLFAKRNNSFQLTTAGSILFDKSGEILSLFDELEDDLKNIDGTNFEKIIVGCGSLAARIIFPEIIKKFLATYPNNDISIFECGSNEMNGLISNDTIDFGTGFKTILKGSTIEFEKLFTSKFKVICSENNIMAETDVIKIEDILELPYISYSTNSVIINLLENYLPTENINKVLNAQYSETIIKYVQLNFGVSIVPDYILKLLKPTGIAIKELDVELSIDFGLFKDKNRYLSPAHKKCIDLVKTYYKKSIESIL
ncbi:MAG: LysR family transcriptional regulator [Desulfobacterales bacterium]|nr:LysR family transcriptional regulator [Desulfobacterales bacterium]